MLRNLAILSRQTHSNYRGRLAPTPSGYLHLGHAATFLRAQERCQAHGGTLLYRDEDIDIERCQDEHRQAAMDDLRWLGIQWQEGPDCGGPYGPYRQSECLERYREAWQKLHRGGYLFPCGRSRRDMRNLPRPAHVDEQDAEPVYPTAWRPPGGTGEDATEPGQTAWRFRVPEGRTVRFTDAIAGEQTFTAGSDFGDFRVWRKNGLPNYELAVVVDDIAMNITEVVRGADLLRSTARQILIYEALGATDLPTFAHCPLVRDEDGQRLAKRTQATSLRGLRDQGYSPQAVRAMATAD
ncbi:MAG: glutamate--tRNA ligase family protein [Verrucomicrobiota bacterium]